MKNLKYFFEIDEVCVMGALFGNSSIIELERKRKQKIDVKKKVCMRSK
jgi:hypothetical protein